MAGNSLGVQPLRARDRVLTELDDWARLGVEGHLEATRPWIPSHQLMRGPTSRLVGARESEVTVMNTLTVNLHLMMISFYRPTAERYAIVIEDSAFPSDSYAARSQASFHGFDPDVAVIRLKPRAGEDCLRTDDVLDFLAQEGHTVAMLMFGGINYLSGELMEIEKITAAGHAAGAVVGWDLAHAAGNVELKLHDWDVDWAAWCNYKYINSGPGAIAACFVHEKHLADSSLPKLQGWWGNRDETRFAMEAEIDAPDTADSWQLSCQPILALVPVLASLEMFDEAGFDRLRAKSVRLTAYLESLLDAIGQDAPIKIITPRDPERRGSQLSIRVSGLDAGDVSSWLRHEHGVIADARKPDVIRFAPAPFYCTFHDAWRAAQALLAVVRDHGQA
nr:kynureninase [Nakamurella antarctica]